MKKSMIETAYQVLNTKGKAVPFIELWGEVSKEMGFTPSQADDNIAQFFSDLSMDGRFTNLKGNSWDLRKRQHSSKTIIDTDSLSVEDEEDSDNEYDNDEEEKEIIEEESDEDDE